MNEPQRNFYVTGGTLQRNAPSYVRRQADVDLHEGLSAGKFCYVLTSRQMGKSSLMVQTAARLREEGIAVAVLDLTAVGQNLTAEQWYDGLLNRTGQQLHLEDELEDFWLENERVGPLQRWMRALREIVLERHKGRIVIFIDEIDAVRSLPFSTDEFFAAIREFYNRRTEDAELQRLTFCLLGVATPSDLIRDTRTTPFNIGQRIELTDFKEAEASPLAAGLGHDDQLGAKLLERILYWTGGHPYLTQRLCLAAAEHAGVINPAAIDRLCDAMFFSARARESDDNLLFVRERILRSEADRAALLDLYAQVRAHRRQRVRDDDTNPLVSILRLAGITRIAEGYHYVRNRIYYRVFDREWINANMPDAELRRQRAAYRRGMARTAAVAAVILFLMAGLAFSALREKRIADREKRIAIEERRRADEKTREAEAALIEVRQERERAVKLQAVAEGEQAEAEVQRKEAEAQRKEAISQKEIAEQQRTLAEEQRQKVVWESQQRRVAEQKAQVEEAAAGLAKTEGARIRRLLYAVNMKQAQQAWEESNISYLHKLLAYYRPGGERAHASPVTTEINQQETQSAASFMREDLRGFEWRYLWRLSHNELSTTRLAQSGEPFLSAFSPDNRRLVTASREATTAQLDQTRDVVTIWDAPTGRRLATLNAMPQPVYSLAVSPDGARLLTGHGRNTLAVWDMATGEDVAVRQRRGDAARFTAAAYAAPAAGVESNDVISAIAFSPDGRMVATGSSDNTIRLLTFPAQSLVTEFKGHAEGISALAFAPDGRTLASGSADNTVKLWEIPATLKEGTKAFAAAATLSGHDGDISFLAFAPHGRLLATGSADNTVKLWDTKTRSRIGPTFRTHTEEITFIAFSPDGKKFATGSADKTMRLWDVPAEPRPTPSNEREATTREEDVSFAAGAVRLEPAGYRPFAGVGFATADARLAWPALNALSPTPAYGAFLSKRPEESPEPLTTLKGHTGTIVSISFSADGKKLTTVAGDNTIMEWADDTAPEWKNLGAHAGSVYALAFSPDGRLLATGNQGARDQSSLQVWNIATGQRILAVKGDVRAINSVAFSPDGRVLASASGGKEHDAKLWDVETGRQLAALNHLKSVFTVAFSRDGKLLATAGESGVVHLWDAATWRDVKQLKGHGKAVEAVAFSPDNRRLASASHDGMVKLWELDTGAETATITADLIGVRAVAFSPDGQYLVTAGGDKIVKLWRIEVTGPKMVAEFEGHANSITYAAFSHDSQRLVTSSNDGTVRLWDVAARQEVATLKGHASGVWIAVFSPDGQIIATGGEDQTVKLWHAPDKF